jgi:hypothetical protein
MKKLILISALFITITGCQTNGGFMGLNHIASHPPAGETFYDDFTTPGRFGFKRASSYASIPNNKGEAIGVNTGTTYYLGNLSVDYFPNKYDASSADWKYFLNSGTNGKNSVEHYVLYHCEKALLEKCVLMKLGNRVLSENRNIADKYEKERQEIAEQRRLNAEQQRIRQDEYQRQRDLRLLEERRAEKERMVAELRERCASYGFSGDENIAACVQREAQHDLELAQQERALRLAQQRLANQSRQPQAQTQVVEEEVPWWLQFLADVAVGVAEGYEQNAIHNSQHKNEKKDIFRDCRPNC